MVAGAGGDECTSDAECAGPGTGTYAEEVPKEEEGYSLSDLWDGFAYVGDLELTWDSFTDNTDCYFEIGSSGFDDSSIGFVGFGANTNLWSGDHLTFNLGGTVGMRNFDLDSEFEENFDTGEPNFETGGNIWDTRTVTGPGEGWEFGATIGPNINIPFEAPALGAFSLDFKAEALLCETGSGYINEAKLNKALSDSVSTFVSTQSGRVDGMDMGTTTMFGFKYNF